MAGTSFDPSRALKMWFGETGRAARMSTLFQALDVRYSRTLTSSYDGAAFDPGLGFQFALGGPDGFRKTQDHLATMASFSDQFTVQTGFLLRKDLTLSALGQFSRSDNYTRRLDNTQALIEGKQQRLPDLGLGWTDSLAWLKNWEPFGRGKFRPLGWLRAITTLRVDAHFVATRSQTFVAAESADQPADLRVDDSKRYPINASIAWNDMTGGLLTNFRYEKLTTTGSHPGSLTQTQTQDLSADLSRSFPLPPSWGLRSRLRAHMGWTQHTSSSYITVQNADHPSRLTDNGTTAFNLNADTDIASNLKFSLSGAHVVSYDNNFNRKLTQFVLTMTFTLQYQTGVIR